MAEHLKIFVTGASSGIGRAVAIELAQRGHTVFAAARRRSRTRRPRRVSPRHRGRPAGRHRPGVDR